MKETTKNNLIWIPLSFIILISSIFIFYIVATAQTRDSNIFNFLGIDGSHIERIQDPDFQTICYVLENDLETKSISCVKN